MSLLSPWSLLWLLPLVGTIVVLWMLRLKRRDLVVSSLFLWQAVVQDTQANTPFQKLRRHWLLFLQLLAAFLLVLALARPFVYGRGLDSRELVVIVDTGASMNARDGHPSRLDSAKQAAEDYLRRNMQPADMAMVMAAGRRPEIESGFTSDLARLQQAIERTQLTDEPARLSPALSLANSLLGGRQGSEIQVYSDGITTPDDIRSIAEMDFGRTDVQQDVVGTVGASNIAITAMDGRRDPGTGQYQVLVTVRNLGRGSAAGGTLSLLLNGRLVDARALSGGGGDQTEIFDSPLLQNGGLISARLDNIYDDLSEDNQATIVVAAPAKTRILLVTRGNLFLERGLNVDPDSLVFECSPEDFTSVGRSGAGYTMVVWDGPLPESPLPPGNYLIFDGGGSNGALSTVGAPYPNPQWVDQNTTHPLMRYVDLTGLHVRRAERAAPASWAESLADGSSGSLIAAGEKAGHRFVGVSFDLSDSDWPLRVSFPIFLANAIDWLTATGRAGAVDEETAPGDPAEVVVPPGQDHVLVDGPGVSGIYVHAPIAGGVVSITDTTRAGIYRVDDGGIDYPFAVDLLDVDASKVTPVSLSALNHPVAPPPVASIPKAHRSKDELWTYVACAVLAFLIVEWVVYHRRL